MIPRALLIGVFLALLLGLVLWTVLLFADKLNPIRDSVTPPERSPEPAHDITDQRAPEVDAIIAHIESP